MDKMKNLRHLVQQARSIGNWDTHESEQTLFAKLVFALEEAEKDLIEISIARSLDVNHLLELHTKIAGLEIVLQRIKETTTDPEVMKLLPETPEDILQVINDIRHEGFEEGRLSPMDHSARSSHE